VLQLLRTYIVRQKCLIQIPIQKHVHMSLIFIKTFELRGQSLYASPFNILQIFILGQCDLIKTLTRDYISNMACTLHTSFKICLYIHTQLIFNPYSLYSMIRASYSCMLLLSSEPFVDNLILMVRCRVCVSRSLLECIGPHVSIQLAQFDVCK
jgi:hypothetical protein